MNLLINFFIIFIERCLNRVSLDPSFSLIIKYFNPFLKIIKFIIHHIATFSIITNFTNFISILWFRILISVWTIWFKSKLINVIGIRLLNLFLHRFLAHLFTWSSWFSSKFKLRKLIFEIFFWFVNWEDIRVSKRFRWVFLRLMRSRSLCCWSIVCFLGSFVIIIISDFIFVGVS